MVGEALPAHRAPLRPRRSRLDSLTAAAAAAAAAEGWCGRSGAGVLVVRCLPRGDPGAWPTRI